MQNARHTIGIFPDKAALIRIIHISPFRALGLVASTITLSNRSRYNFDAVLNLEGWGGIGLAQRNASIPSFPFAIRLPQADTYTSRGEERLSGLLSMLIPHSISRAL